MGTKGGQTLLSFVAEFVCYDHRELRSRHVGPVSVHWVRLNLEVLHPRRGAQCVNLKAYSAAPM